MNDTIPAITSRGEQAKNQLIQAAIAQFGKHGNRATTRDIATAAGQNISAIRYYFAGKEDLYIACAQWIADFIGEQFLPYTETAIQLLNLPDPDKTAMHKLIHTAFQHLLRLMTTNETMNISRFISREQLSPTGAYQHIYRQVIAPLLQYLTLVLARYTGKKPDIEIMIHVHALLGEIMSFRLSRETLLLSTGWDDFDQQKTEQVYQVVGKHIDLILQGLSETGTV